ncbi:MAG: T9SS type A sorting domain-containing protein [Salibacteraceae bacterium]
MKSKHALSYLLFFLLFFPVLAHAGGCDCGFKVTLHRLGQPVQDVNVLQFKTFVLAPDDYLKFHYYGQPTWNCMPSYCAYQISHITSSTAREVYTGDRRVDQPGKYMFCQNGYGYNFDECNVFWIVEAPTASSNNGVKGASNPTTLPLRLERISNGRTIRDQSVHYIDPDETFEFKQWYSDRNGETALYFRSQWQLNGESFNMHFTAPELQYYSFSQIGYADDIPYNSFFTDMLENDRLTAALKDTGTYTLWVEGEPEISFRVTHTIVEPTTRDLILPSIEPNPINETVRIRFGDVRTRSLYFEVYSLNGQLMASGNRQLQSQGLHIEAGQWASGTYVLHLNVDGKPYQMKFIRP